LSGGSGAPPKKGVGGWWLSNGVESRQAILSPLVFSLASLLFCSFFPLAVAAAFLR